MQPGNKKHVAANGKEAMPEALRAPDRVSLIPHTIYSLPLCRSS
jgi:hypothetical protein